jgi:hypothetical protein
VDNSTETPFPASYDGLALGKNSHGQEVLYAADGGLSPTASNNRIDMFDGSFHSLGSFTDPNVASQYPGNTAYQVTNVGGKLYVTFAGFTPPFGGVVDVFDTDGHLLTPNHFAANAAGAGPLVNPWGVALAPANFGTFSNDLLIGNVEDGHINAFNPGTGQFLGSLTNPAGTPLVITGLWALDFGAGSKNNGTTNQLFFTAGPTAANPPGNGLFGMITAVNDAARVPALAVSGPDLTATGPTSLPGRRAEAPVAMPGRQERPIPVGPERRRLEARSLLPQLLNPAAADLGGGPLANALGGDEPAARAGGGHGGAEGMSG